MTTTINSRNNEISIGGVIFRVRDLMKVTNLSVAPNPVAFGDTTRSSETQAMIQLIQSSYTGGSGKFMANVRTDAERFWTSGWNTKFRDQLSFPPEVVDLGIPPGALVNMSCSAEFLNELYFGIGTSVYRLVNSTDTLVQEIIGLQNVTDMVVYKNTLFVAHAGSPLSYYAYKTGGAWASGLLADHSDMFAVWNNTLYTVYWDGAKYATSRTTAVGPEVWTTGIGDFEQGLTVYQLQVYMDANSTSALYAMTSKGPWIYNFNDSRWQPTDVIIPTLGSGETSKSARFRDGKLYMSSGGLSMLSIQNGNPMVVGAMGLDREDGVPVEEQGVILAVASDLNFVYALTQAATSTGGTSDTMNGLQNPLGSYGFSPYTGPATLRAWNSGWHKDFVHSTAANVGSHIAVASTYSKRRLYFGINNHLYYMSIPAGLYNPKRNPNQRYHNTIPVHETPWWDFGNWTQEKIHGHLLFETEGCDANNYVDVYYGKDLNPTYIYIGRINTNGLNDLYITYQGVQSRFFRYKLLGVKNPLNALEAPRVLTFTSEVMRVLPPTYGFGFEIDFTHSVDGLTPKQQLAAFKTLIDSQQTEGFLPFAYEDEAAGAVNTYYGRISRVNGQEAIQATMTGKGFYQVTFIVPYTRDKT